MKAEIRKDKTIAPVGTVWLHAGERVDVDVPDEADRGRVNRAFEAGDIIVAWSWYGEGEPAESSVVETKAERMTPRWFRRVLFDILEPEGYRSTITDDHDEV
jgi:hypothetical protein